MGEERTRKLGTRAARFGPTSSMAPHPEVYFQQGSIRGLTDKERFEQLCELVTAAYNSPDIIIAMNPGKSFLAGGGEAGNYRNGRIHGFNGCFIGWEVFQEGLFVQRP